MIHETMHDEGDGNTGWRCFGLRFAFSMNENDWMADSPTGHRSRLDYQHDLHGPV